MSSRIGSFLLLCFCATAAGASTDCPELEGRYLCTHGKDLTSPVVIKQRRLGAFIEFRINDKRYVTDEVEEQLADSTDERSRLKFSGIKVVARCDNNKLIHRSRVEITRPSDNLVVSTVILSQMSREQDGDMMIQTIIQTNASTGETLVREATIRCTPSAN